MTLIAAAVVLAATAFKTPLPVPDLVGGSPDTVFTQLGEPDRIVKGVEAKKICANACDEIRVYGPETAPPELTTASAFVYLEKNRVTSVKWIFPGKLAKPDSYPRFSRAFEDGEAPLDLEELEAHDPITVETVTDATRRKVSWVHRGYEWTAIVLCPLVREVEGADLFGMRKALPEEWRLVLVEAGPLKVERKKIACDPSGQTPFHFHPGETLPDAKRGSRFVAPIEIGEGEVKSPVVIDLDVDADGKVTAARLIRGHARLASDALDGARKIRYEPFLCEGKPIPWTGRIAVDPP